MGGADDGLVFNGKNIKTDLYPNVSTPTITCISQLIQIPAVPQIFVFPSPSCEYTLDIPEMSHTSEEAKDLIRSEKTVKAVLGSRVEAKVKSEEAAGSGTGVTAAESQNSTCISLV